MTIPTGMPPDVVPRAFDPFFTARTLGLERDLDYR